MLILLKNSIVWDSRVKKILNTFKRNGIETHLLSVEKNKENLPVDNEQNSVVIHKNRRIVLPGVSRLLLNCKFLYKSLKLGRRHHTVYCNDLNTLLFGVLCRLLFKCRVIYDSHEYAVDETIGAPLWKKCAIKSYQMLLLKWVDKVVTVSPLIAKQLVIDNPFVSEPIVVKNLPEITQDTKPLDIVRKYSLKDSTIKIVYHGNISSNFVVESLIETFDNMSWDGVEFLVFGVGSKVQDLKNLSTRFSHVHIFDPVSPSILYSILAGCDFGLVVYQQGCLNHEYCFPNKYFDYLACGVIPIVPQLKQLSSHIAETGYGIHAFEISEFGDLKSLKDKMDRIYHVKNYKNEYTWESSEQVIVDYVINL